jgi:hypothetical protein
VLYYQILVMMRRNPVPFILIGISILLLVGCLDPAQPSVHIIKPVYGKTVPSGTVTVMVRVENGSFNASHDHNRGHLHYFLDRAAPIIPGEPAITQPGTYASSAYTTYTWKNVTAGRHTFSVELVNGDDTPYDPAVRDQIQIDVE